MSYNLKEIKIEVTQKCPLNCLHCSSEANSTKTQELTENLVIQIIKEGKKLGITEVVLSGGEPLLWESLPYVIEYCKSIDLRLVIYTTGIPFIKNKSLLPSLIKSGLRNVVVSLYGASEDIHEYITRVHGSFIDTISAITGMIFNGINVGIHFVAMSPNWKQLPAVVDLAIELGISKISVLRFVPHGRGSLVKDIFSLSVNELQELRKDISSLRANKKSITIRIGSPFNILLLNDDVFCLAALDRAIIGPDGKIFPCDAFKNLNFSGCLSSLDEGSFTDLWYNSDYLTHIRNELKKGLGPVCSSCVSKDKCKGGCLAQKILRLKDGGALNTDPDCIHLKVGDLD